MKPISNMISTRGDLVGALGSTQGLHAQAVETSQMCACSSTPKDMQNMDVAAYCMIAQVCSRALNTVPVRYSLL